MPGLLLCSFQFPARGCPDVAIPVIDQLFERRTSGSWLHRQEIAFPPVRGNRKERLPFFGQLQSGKEGTPVVDRAPHISPPPALIALVPVEGYPGGIGRGHRRQLG